MGQRLADDIIEAGAACTACENALWGIGKTPKNVYAHFSGMERCPGVDWDVHALPPNNHTFKLEQIDGFPCRWRYRGTMNWGVNWRINIPIIGNSSITLGHIGFTVYFQCIPDPPNLCEATFANQNVCGGLILASGGFCWIEWKQIAIDLAKGLNLTLAPTLFYEVFQTGLMEVVYKFTDKVRGINVKHRLEL